jgi:hypothetical protein
MGFKTGEFPQVDAETFIDQPLLERIRTLTTHWVEHGFGTPKLVHGIYIVKLLVMYILGGVLSPAPPPVWDRSGTSPAGGRNRSSIRSSSCGPCCWRRSGWPDRGGHWPATSSR